MVELKQYEHHLLNKWRYELKVLIATGIQLDCIRDEIKGRMKDEI